MHDCNIENISTRNAHVKIGVEDINSPTAKLSGTTLDVIPTMTPISSDLGPDRVLPHYKELILAVWAVCTARVALI
jgi:hypothetical protein